MFPRIRRTPQLLDLEAALLMHSDAYPSGESFKLYLRSLRKPKKKRASKPKASLPRRHENIPWNSFALITDPPHWTLTTRSDGRALNRDLRFLLCNLDPVLQGLGIADDVPSFDPVAKEEMFPGRGRTVDTIVDTVAAESPATTPAV